MLELDDVLEVQIDELNQMQSNGLENTKGKRCNGKRNGMSFLSTRGKKMKGKDNYRNHFQDHMFSD